MRFMPCRHNPCLCEIPLRIGFLGGINFWDDMIWGFFKSLLPLQTIIEFINPSCVRVT